MVLENDQKNQRPSYAEQSKLHFSLKIRQVGLTLKNVPAKENDSFLDERSGRKNKKMRSKALSLEIIKLCVQSNC